MEIFAAIFMLEVAAVALTALGCRLALRYNHLAGWYLALLGAIVSSILFTLVTDSGFLFHPDRWEHSKSSFGIVIRGFMLWLGITIIPCLEVVRHYRKRISHPK